jgi:catabolite regulation protein CreA
VRQDCVRMSKSTHRLLEDVSRASVDCRRLGKPTAQYQKTIERAQESVYNLERYIMLAQLMT